MGSGQSFCESIPKDLSTATDRQLQQIIDVAILAEPWYDPSALRENYDRHCLLYRDLRQLSKPVKPTERDHFLMLDRFCESLEIFALKSTIAEARQVGFRPISTCEYRLFLQEQLRCSGVVDMRQIKLWVTAQPIAIPNEQDTLSSSHVDLSLSALCPQTNTH